MQLVVHWWSYTIRESGRTKKSEDIRSSIPFRSIGSFKAINTGYKGAVVELPQGLTSWMNTISQMSSFMFTILCLVKQIGKSGLVAIADINN